ncbi:hypothetical protein EVAR_90956_1 [Eumeta japonica]|uniref:Uncharacterized protein n=1 Tax=Eumeta variegata TaxID=151549 RepID=A0A4C1ZCW6_EUMVA|nr:hypothetical protein EVAR_90956_1 [Eumeta japonica]
MLQLIPSQKTTQKWNVEYRNTINLAATLYHRDHANPCLGRSDRIGDDNTQPALGQRGGLNFLSLHAGCVAKRLCGGERLTSLNRQQNTAALGGNEYAWDSSVGENLTGMTARRRD